MRGDGCTSILGDAVTGYKSKKVAAQDKVTDIDGHVVRDVRKLRKPQQRPWVGLTDEEIQPRLNGLPTQSIAVYARNIEAILKEKNNG